MVRRLFEDSEPGTRPIGAGSATLEAGEAPVPGGAPTVAPPTVRLGAPRRRPRELGWLGDLAALVFLCVLAVALTWPLARHPASTLPDLGDPLDSAWRLAWPAHQLPRNPAHLFDANIFYPVKTSYLFDELILGVALLVAPVTLATGNGVLAFNVAIMLAAAGNGLGMYFLARRLSGSRWAALAAALVYAAAPFRLWHIGHVGLSTAVWMPLALLFLDRCLHAPSWRDALAFGACVAMQSLSAQYYGFQVAIVAGLYLLYALARRREAVLAPPFVGRLIAATVFAEALLFPVVAPYVAVKGTWGYTRGLEENELYSATLSSFLAAPSDYLLAGPLSAKLRGALRVHDWALWLYPGLGAVVLAVLGIFRPRPARRVRGEPARPVAEAIGARTAPLERRARGKPARPQERLDLYPFMVGLALFGAVMTLGPVLYPQAIGLHAVTRWMPYRLFFNTVPVFDAMRAPERFGNVILLGLGGAVSYGVAAVLATQRGLSRRVRAVAVPLVAVALLVATGAEYVRAPLHPRTVPPAPPVYAWLAGQPVGPAIELPPGSPPSELNREQVRQYWSTTHWQPRLNGSSDLQPYAFTALRRDLDAFPNPRTLGILQGLGVRYVILHRAQYPRAEWDRLAAVYNSYRVTLQPRGQFGDDFAYELQPDDRFATLRKTIAPGADVFLSGNDPDVTDTDPNGSDAYMAMVGYLLRDHRLITRIVPTFGQRYTRPEPGKLAAYAIVYKTESPTRYNYPAGMPVVYEDNVVRVYRRPGK